MNILVVNDDGYDAEGIKILVDSLKSFGNIYVMAPNTQQSGASQSITLHTYVRLHERDNFGEDVKAWSIEGTPADCVIYAINYLDLDIDLVVSGINAGPNIATDALYSGTVAGATEGLAQNIPSMAFSADYGSFDLAKKEMGSLLKLIFDNELYSKDYVLNINFPSNTFKEIKGNRVTNQGIRPLIHNFEDEGDKIWPKFRAQYNSGQRDTDLHAFLEGYTSLCPLGLIRLHEEGKSRLENIVK